MPKARFRSLAASVCAGLALMLSTPAAADETMTEAETEAIERVVRGYLLEHPEIIIEALQVLETRNRQQAIDALLADKAAPVAGNPEGPLTVVEFFDYQCPYCKTIAADMIETLEAEGDVRIVFKEFPILGQASEYAAKAALAAHRQGKYLEFHQALMAARGKLNERMVIEEARRVGLDVERLQADMDSPEIAAALERNHELATALQVNGTPAFVVGKTVVPGQANMINLIQQLLEAERSS
ncbi:DsbA family protein [Rhodospirillaceae bacterium SYSU D60014]|uniref:DsbA family protein n=1 Tax=Virgifigura deserti TaxID=2268457 RepID=UPI000E667924